MCTSNCGRHRLYHCFLMSMLSCIVYYFEYKLICRFVCVWLSPVRASSMIHTNAWKVIVRYAFLTNIPRLSSMSHCINEANGFFLCGNMCIGCYFSQIINERFGEETRWCMCWTFLFLSFFSVALVSVLRGHSVFSSQPQWPMTFDWTFLIQHLYFVCIIPAII